METNLKLDKGEEEEKVDACRYRRLVGRLLYLQVTRPDIAYSVNILSQFVGDLRRNHMEATNRVLRYLKTTFGQGILQPKMGDINLVAYCDSDWLGCSLKAEYQAMATSVSEIIWVRWLLKGLDAAMVGPTLLLCDNQVANHIANNPVFHEWTKHVEMDCYFVRERVERKEIEPVHINSKQQV
ncbi:secreted RxLR effector protein 161-like protein, partial [Tanacetum coccineum]